jgi:hypothetical protein
VFVSNQCSRFYLHLISGGRFQIEDFVRLSSCQRYYEKRKNTADFITDSWQIDSDERGRYSDVGYPLESRALPPIAGNSSSKYVNWWSAMTKFLIRPSSHLLEQLRTGRIMIKSEMAGSLVINSFPATRRWTSLFDLSALPRPLVGMHLRAADSCHVRSRPRCIDDPEKLVKALLKDSPHFAGTFLVATDSDTNLAKMEVIGKKLNLTVAALPFNRSKVSTVYIHWISSSSSPPSCRSSA